MLDQSMGEPTVPAPSVVASPGETIEVLERRLNRGWKVIAQAESRGEVTDDLFAHFLVLLKEYETIYDSIDG